MSIEIIAHRGASHEAPENTVAAFELGWSEGASACELDLHLTADNRIVAIHDKTTKRTTDVDRVVADSTLLELQKLDAGSWKSPTYVGERIPTLAAALHTLPADQGRFFLEIKCGTKMIPLLAKELNPWRGKAHRLCIIAFSEAVARESKKVLPWIEVCRLSSAKTRFKVPVPLDGLIQSAVRDQLDGLSLSSEWDWDAAMVETIHHAGLKACVWTVNDPTEARRLHELGVDGITTDAPRRILQALDGPR
jgi:glycerophosphoryl diester phosphodiesterase